MASDERRLRIGAAVTEGFSLVASRNGLVLAGAFYIAQTATFLLVMAGGLLYLPLDQAAGVAGSPSAFPAGTELPTAGSVGAMILATTFGTIVTVPLTIIAIRTFVVGATDRIPDDCLFHRIGHATASAVGASLGITVAMILPFVLAGATVFGLVRLLDGVAVLALGALVFLIALVTYALLWLHFLFVIHEIAVRDRGVVDAFRGSWATVGRARLRVFVLAVALVGVQSGVNWATVPSLQDPPSPLWVPTMLVAFTASAALTVVYTAVLARAYRQLSAVDSDRGPVGN